MADKKISQLDLAAQINNDAVIPMSQENGGEQTTYKALITALGAKIAEGLTFSNLATTAKNLVGAINELQAGGGGGGAAILIGTTTPSSSQGSNGNLYIKYTEGVGGADDTVDAIYVKLDGTWCKVTTDYADLLNKPSINSNTLSGNKTNNDLGIYGKTIEMSSTDPDKVADRITALEMSVSDIGTVHSLILSTSITTTATDYNTYSSRKFSDYDLIIFKFGASAYDTRQSVVLPISEWVSGRAINMGALHGSSVSTPSSYSYSSINITYKSDTSITALASGSAGLNNLVVYGIKIKA